MMTIVYRREDNKKVQEFTTRQDAVFWCMVNRVFLLSDGAEWDDDYYLTDSKGNWLP